MLYVKIVASLNTPMDHKKIFALLPTPVIILLPDDPEFTIVEVNAAYLELATMTRDQLINRGFFEATNHNKYQNYPEGIDLLRMVLEDKEPHQSPMRRYQYPAENGTYYERYFNVLNVPVLNENNEVELIIRSVTDITEIITTQKKEEITKTRLHETSIIMEQGQELANFGNWRWDIADDKVSWSEALYGIYGLDKNSFKANFEGYRQLLHPDDRERVYQLITGALQNGKDVVFEERIIRPNGEMRYLRSWGKVQADCDGKPATMIGACLDITESKLAEIKLQEMHHELELNLQTLAISEKKYSSLFQFSPLPMWVLDIDTLRFLDVNQAAVEHYGYSRNEFLSMTVKKLWKEADVEAFAQQVASKEETYSLVSEHLTKAGNLIHVHIQSTMINFNGKNTRLILAEDITEKQKHIQAIEEQNKKLHEIAWVQSHVVRVPVARIIGLIELYKNYTNSEIDRQQLINNILISANELDSIIKEISGKTDKIFLSENNNALNN